MLHQILIKNMRLILKYFYEGILQFAVLTDFRASHNILLPESEDMYYILHLRKQQQLCLIQGI